MATASNKSKRNLINQFDFMHWLCCNHWMCFSCDFMAFPRFSALQCYVLLNKNFSLSSTNTQNTPCNLTNRFAFCNSVAAVCLGSGERSTSETQCVFIVFYCPNISNCQSVQVRLAFCVWPIVNQWSNLFGFSGVFGELLNGIYHTNYEKIICVMLFMIFFF